MTVTVGYAVVELFFLIVKVWALVTCLRYPQSAWEEAGHSRSMWLIVLIIGLFLPCLGFLAAVWFLLGVSTDVSRVTKLGGRPGFPGGIPD